MKFLKESLRAAAFMGCAFIAATSAVFGLTMIGFIWPPLVAWPLAGAAFVAATRVMEWKIQ